MPIHPAPKCIILPVWCATHTRHDAHTVERRISPIRRILPYYAEENTPHEIECNVHPLSSQYHALCTSPSSDAHCPRTATIYMPMWIRGLASIRGLTQADPSGRPASSRPVTYRCKARIPEVRSATWTQLKYERADRERGGTGRQYISSQLLYESLKL